MAKSRFGRDGRYGGEDQAGTAAVLAAGRDTTADFGGGESGVSAGAAADVSGG